MRVYVCLNLCAQSHTHTHTHSDLLFTPFSPPFPSLISSFTTHTHIIIVSIIIIFLLSRRVVVGWRRRRRRRQQQLHIRSEHVHYVHSSYNADEVHSQHSHLRLLVQVYHLHLTRPRRHHVRRREALIVRIVTMTQTRDTSSRWAGQLRAISAAERRQYVARSCL